MTILHCLHLYITLRTNLYNYNIFQHIYFRLFNYSDRHCTDGWQSVCGKALIVSVISHLLTPLKDYFESDRDNDSSERIGNHQH